MLKHEYKRKSATRGRGGKDGIVSLTINTIKRQMISGTTDEIYFT